MKDSLKPIFSDIEKELKEENLAIFAGAGMSMGAGFVNWSELLKPIAEELGLCIEKETDFVALAQYHCNDNGNNRSQLNKRLIEEFSKDAIPTENHKILSRLPIRTYWTTNYDKLIERSLSNSGKIPDVKYTKNQLLITKPNRDAVVYKMHGDIDHPNEAILTKDDYEKYHIEMDTFLSNLKGDLITKTFLFIGFSFTDPNLDYILSRVRVAHAGNQRRHYCFIHNVIRDKNDSDADFDYKKRKQELFVDDLKRFNIKVILIDSYTEITEFLIHLEKRYKKNTIFISGAAHEYGSFGERNATEFVYKLSSELVRRHYNIVSGFGLGIGSAVISGALEEIYLKKGHKITDQLILRPFPQSTSGSIALPELWRQYREDMINHAGVAIFVYGNKKVDDKVVLSIGMQQEYEIAKSKGLLIIPLGLTGYMAKEIWTAERKRIEDDNVSSQYVELFEKLNDSTLSLENLSKVIFDMLTFNN